MAIKLKINLTKIKGAFLHNLIGKTDTKLCLIIPIHGSMLEQTDKGIYLHLTGFELTNKKGQSHILKQTIPDELYYELNTEQRNSYPVIGGITNLNTQTK